MTVSLIAVLPGVSAHSACVVLQEFHNSQEELVSEFPSHWLTGYGPPTQPIHLTDGLYGAQIDKFPSLFSRRICCSRLVIIVTLEVSSVRFAIVIEELFVGD
ncbi:hypothetical protein BDF14DRAFT_1856292 [Spinellus fusiger]|nr:hypothetical protein BDF14DRAFT_1856292 [Spinellus fusiger]